MNYFIMIESTAFCIDSQNHICGQFPDYTIVTDRVMDCVDVNGM